MLSLAIAGCAEERDRSYLTAYTTGEIEKMNEVATTPLYLPTFAPKGLDKTEDPNGDPPFSLADVNWIKDGRDTAWTSAYEGDYLGTTFRVTQRSTNSTLDACLDWKGADHFTLTPGSTRDVTIAICALPGDQIELKAADYWRSVGWTTNPDEVAWMKP